MYSKYERLMYPEQIEAAEASVVASDSPTPAPTHTVTFMSLAEYRASRKEVAA